MVATDPTILPRARADGDRRDAGRRMTLVLVAAALAPPAGSGEAAADTLRFAIPSGEALVTSLPGESEATFRAERAPALSWLVGRSFFWQTVPAERGREFVLLERERDGRTDTLVLVIDVGTE